MPFYTYRCAAGHIAEKLASRDAEVTVCSCGEAARRDSVYRVGVSGFAHTPQGQMDMSRDYRRFTEASGEMDYKASRIEAADGVPVETPNFYRAAKEEALKMAGAGVTADEV